MKPQQREDLGQHEVDRDGLRIIADGPTERALIAEWIAASATGNGPVRILEAGCGQHWPISIDIDLHITGVDTDAVAMRIRRETHGDLDVEIVGDLRSVELPAESFDVVYCSYVLEHVEGAELVMDRLVAATRPGGRLVIRIPDGQAVYGRLVKHSPHRTHVLYKRYVEGFENAGKPGHAPYPTVYDQIVSRRGMHAFADDRNLRVVAEYGRNTYLANFGKARPIVAGAVKAVAAVSAGRLSGSHGDLGIILERPEH